MIRLSFSIALDYEVRDGPADFIFNVSPARTASQTVVAESLDVSPPEPIRMYTDRATASCFARVRANPGPFNLRSFATVDIDHHLEEPGRIAECAIADIPPQVLPYVYPSRYCPSDRLREHARREFGHLAPGYARVRGIHDWVFRHTKFTTGASHAATDAIDTLVSRAGVCRDFAHLMISLCRALNIPARFVTGIDYGAPPSMGETDFHAYVEAYLGKRWYAFDPTGISPPMGLVRLGTGRDAADVAFATIFGSISASRPRISISAVEDAAAGLVLPRHSIEAISTGSEPHFVTAGY